MSFNQIPPQTMIDEENQLQINGASLNNFEVKNFHLKLFNVKTVCHRADLNSLLLLRDEIIRYQGNPK